MSRASGCLGVLVGLIASCSIGTASTINFAGNFLFDDDVHFFTYQSPTTGTVTVNTTSFAQGGFAPILTLYDASGNFLFSADGTTDAFCAGTDILSTGFCYDASMTWTSLAGVSYYVAISQYDNFPTTNPIPVNAPITTWNSADTFSEFGNPFFTANSPFGPGCGQSGFCLNDGNARGSNWALTFTGPTGLVGSQVPETGTIFLIIGGLAMICGRLLQVRRRAVRGPGASPAR
jgi:hypothetical protein